MSSLRSGSFLVCVLAMFAASSGAAGAAGPSFAKASKDGDGPRLCTGGAFLDARLDDWSIGPQCWSCPKNHIRTLDPVTAPRACFKDGGTDHKKAKFKHKWLCDGDAREFLDPRKGGECWKCPASKPRRTLYKVTSKKACATAQFIGEELGKATYVRKAKLCSDGAFFDPRRGGECWKCPSGHTRTHEAVTAKKACAKETPDAYAAATLEHQLGCARGQFLDPRNGGECWECPAGHKYRTAYAVTSDKACTDSPLGILAVEENASCKELVLAVRRVVREGDKATAALEAATRPILEPVASVLQRELAKMTDLAGDFEALDPIIAKVDLRLVDRVAGFGESFGGAVGPLRDLLLNPNVCDMEPRALEKILKRHLTLPSGMDGFIGISLAVTFTHSLYKATVQLGVTLLTDLGGQGGFFVNGKIGATTSQSPLGIGLAAMLYPGAKLDDFGLSPAPGITVSVAKGDGFDELFEKFPVMLKATKVIDGVDICWSPASPTKLPTFGVAKGIAAKGSVQDIFDFTAVAGWDFAIWKWSDYKLR